MASSLGAGRSFLAATSATRPTFALMAVGTLFDTLRACICDCVVRGAFYKLGCGMGARGIRPGDDLTHIDAVESRKSQNLWSCRCQEIEASAGLSVCREFRAFPCLVWWREDGSAEGGLTRGLARDFIARDSGM
ncbi:hypothetical protein B0T14DRAFT_10321 [Immersiella caudata]|uniref:Uncharacterized protein n=1 Tax=Immersiella caudata TaxID=314043 RepID=A0AA40CBX5_9PEZI|nr:hypothetical protein B0T14DRAFT_10321 [Immersiella caudata]